MRAEDPGCVHNGRDMGRGICPAYAAVIGAGRESIHAIKKAREAGLKVLALDGNKDAAGLDWGDEAFVKRDNISYNISLPVRRAIFLQVLKNPYSAGFPAYFPFLSCRSKARIFAGTFQS